MPTTQRMSSALQSYRHHKIAAIACALALVATTAPLAAQTAPSEVPEIDIADLNGFTLTGDFNDVQEATWTDPVRLAGLDPNDLEPAPDFDRADFHESSVFATGVDHVPTRDDDELDQIVDRHVRVLQTVATLDRNIDRLASQIDDHRSDLTTLVDQINEEREQESRLADEISVLERAVAELAVRTFIGEDDLHEALTEASTTFGRTRVVSDEVRTDQFAQLDERRTELTVRQRRKNGYQNDLDGVRIELRELTAERLTQLQSRREIQALTTQTKASYQVALHTRLPDFVEGTTIPLVALNAYVIASRTLAQERPQCGITWSMLAGIGSIESFHGHFGDSTLDINGHTTQDIRGPALDGRILQGAEFLEADDEVPGATSRTQDLELPPTPTPAAPTSGSAPVATQDERSEANAEPSNDREESSAPAPVIRRLALITDTDDGRLDGDTTFDRAVGPMQFIPSTWRLFEQDGNLDGELDPQNIYDAALASARYLCASTSTMTTLDGELRAYFAYNHDEQYSQNVHQRGVGYSELIEIPALDATTDEGTPDDELEADTQDTSGTRPLGIAEPGQDSLVGPLKQQLRELPRFGFPIFIE